VPSRNVRFGGSDEEGHVRVNVAEGVAPFRLRQSRGDGVGSGSSRRKPPRATRYDGSTGPLVAATFEIFHLDTAQQTVYPSSESVRGRSRVAQTERVRRGERTLVADRSSARHFSEIDGDSNLVARRSKE
jgi:hypothetical protein